MINNLFIFLIIIQIISFIFITFFSYKIYKDKQKLYNQIKEYLNREEINNEFNNVKTDV